MHLCNNVFAYFFVCTFAVVLGCSVTELRMVTELMPAVFVPQMLFAGFFVRTSLIPVWLRWAQYLCGLKYALNLLMLAEFDPDSCADSADDDVSEEMARTACKNLLDVNDVKREDWPYYVAMLAVLFAGFRVLGATILSKKAQRFY